MTTIKKVLVVEDSPMVTKVVRHLLRTEPGIQAFYAASFAEARALLLDNPDFFAALVDLNLPDAEHGEVVDYTLEQGLPTIVLTGSFDEARREQLLSRGIVDYVAKEGRFSYQYAINLINRLHKNQDIQVLVVDDSDTSRSFISELLKRHRYQVLTAADGVEAIRVLLDNPDIKLLITDYNMPRMDGFELVQTLRSKYDKSDLVIIGLSAEGQASLSAKFIKNGANDFLQKPFNHEEFYCRLMHNVESLELIAQIRDAANRDPLTGAYNRHYLFAVGQQLHAQALQQQTPLAAAVLDLDHLQEINDHYGQEAGDQVLQQLAARLQETLSRFIVASVGAGDFFVLLPGLDNDKAQALLDRVRAIVASTAVTLDGEQVAVTFSAGVSNLLGDSLDSQLKLAAVGAQRAKEAGRNMVVGDDTD